MIWSDPIDQDAMVGGEHEEGRNQSQNHLRIQRIDDLVLGSKKEYVQILDFGCGHGYFVNDLHKSGYVNAVGYDAFNEEYNRLPKYNKFHLVTMTEVCEHISHPFLEFDFIYKCLLPGGVIMIETSFTNIAEEDGIKMEDFFYIAPQNGHSTIHSHHSLDLLMATKRFKPMPHINRHVRLYVKTK